ncbi:MAG: NADPH-dependent F420 reductase [Steroidobacteraceae bacterium]
MSSELRHARMFFRAALLAAAGLAAFGLPAVSLGADGATTYGPVDGVMRIGIIGAGKQGGTLASLWADAGYQVMISSRNPKELQSLAQSIGHGVRVGEPQSAAEFGDVVVIAVPYAAEPKLGQELAPQLAGKVVIDLGNPYPERDGPMAVQARREGTGVASAKFFPGARLVRAFNAISYVSLRKYAHRAGDPIAIPIAANGKHAIAVTERLVRAAGFAPVVVGPLSSAKRFDVGTAVYVKDLTVSQTRTQLGLPAH